MRYSVYHVLDLMDEYKYSQLTYFYLTSHVVIYLLLLKYEKLISLIFHYSTKNTNKNHKRVK